MRLVATDDDQVGHGRRGRDEQIELPKVMPAPSTGLQHHPPAQDDVFAQWQYAVSEQRPKGVRKPIRNDRGHLKVCSLNRV